MAGSHSSPRMARAPCTGISLEQQAVERTSGKCLADRIVALKGCSTAKCNVAPKGKEALHGGAILTKAVEHATRSGNTHLFEHARCIGMGLAGFIPVVIAKMKLNRNIASNGKLDLPRHDVHLQIVRSRLDVIVRIEW